MVRGALLPHSSSRAAQCCGLTGRTIFPLAFLQLGIILHLEERYGFHKVPEEESGRSTIQERVDALEAETQIMRSMIEARLETGMTQKQLSEKTGIKHS